MFVFPGQGAQWAGMGRELFEAFPVFADAVRRCAIRTWLFDAGDGSGSHDNTQLGLFAVEVGLVRLLESWGVTPDLVMGIRSGRSPRRTSRGCCRWRMR